MKKISIFSLSLLSLALAISAAYGMDSKKPGFNIKNMPKTVRWLAGMGIATGTYAVWYFGQRFNHEDPSVFRKLFGYSDSRVPRATIPSFISADIKVEDLDEFAPFTTPSQEAIEKCLRANGLQYFNEKTKFSQRNSDKELTPLGALLAVDIAKYDYAQYLNGHPHQNLMLTPIEMNSDSILSCLAGHSKAKALRETRRPAGPGRTGYYKQVS